MKIKSLFVSLLALSMTVGSVLATGNVKLSWDAYPTTDASVKTIKIYATTGTNTVFTAGNSNAVVVVSTSVTNTTLTVSNLVSGAWTFTATASTTNGLESLNSNTVWTNVLPNTVTAIRITP